MRVSYSEKTESQTMDLCATPSVILGSICFSIKQITTSVKNLNVSSIITALCCA